MKTIILILALTLCSAFCMASDDKAEYECLYRLSYLTDTVNIRQSSTVMALRIGCNSSLFHSLAQFERDSLSKSANSYIELKAIYDSIHAKYGRALVPYYIVKNFQTNRLEVIDEIGKRYKYTENLPDFQWTYTDEKKMIGEHECQKATCSFAGRKYEAWFTTDIPTSDGPWKFHGLPGLILEVYDTQHHYEFAYLGTRPCAGSLSVPVENYIKATKEDLLRIQQLAIDDPNAYIEWLSSSMGIKVSSSKKAPKRYAYATMERVNTKKKKKK